MTKQQYKTWAKQFFKQAPEMPKKLFFEMVELADDLRFSKSNLTHHMESSFNSQNGLNSIKAAHIFHYPNSTEEKCAKDFIKYKILIKFVEKLNENFEVNFNTAALKFVLSIPLSKGRKNDGIVFYADFNHSINQFDKISLHFNPNSPRWIPKIVQALKIKKLGDISLGIENLEFLGLDFYPDEKCGLKIYQEIKSLPKSLGKRVKKIFDEIRKFKPIETIILMERVNIERMNTGKDVYFYCNNLNCQQLLSLSPLKSYKNFLKLIKPFVNNLNLNWIIFKDNKLELYFR